MSEAMAQGQGMHAVTALLLLAGLWSVICRLNKMVHRRTQPVVVVQHLVLGMAMAGALVLPPLLSEALLAGAIVCWLLAGAHRWRYAAPADTDTSPGGLDELDALRQVVQAGRARSGGAENPGRRGQQRQSP